LEFVEHGKLKAQCKECGDFSNHVSMVEVFWECRGSGLAEADISVSGVWRELLL
jgi:hypothetical protein